MLISAGNKGYLTKEFLDFRFFRNDKSIKIVWCMVEIEETLKQIREKIEDFTAGFAESTEFFYKIFLGAF